MPGRVYEGDLTVPAGTPVSAPVTSSVPLITGLLRRVTLEVPGGHGGLTGWQLLIAGTPVIPFAGQRFLTADHYTDSWELNQEVNPGQVQVAGYNTDIYPHTFYARLLWEPVPPPPAVSVVSADGAAAAADITAFGDLSSAPVGPDVTTAAGSPYTPLCYDLSGNVVDCASPDAVAGPVTYTPPSGLPTGPPAPPPAPQPPVPPPEPFPPGPQRPHPPPRPPVHASRLVRHVADGRESLDAAARAAHTTTALVIDTTRHHAPISRDNLADFNAYVTHGTHRRMPRGLVWWSVQPVR